MASTHVHRDDTTRLQPRCTCAGAALLLVVIAGVVSGLAPAVMATRTDLNVAVKAGGRGAAGEPRAMLPRRAGRRSGRALADAPGQRRLVPAQSRSRAADRAWFRSRQPRRRVRRFRLKTATTRRSAWTSITSARERIRALPGVEQAAWIEWAPLATVSEGGPVWIDGQPPRAGEQAFMAALARGRCGLLRDQPGTDSRRAGVRRP